MKNFWDQLPKPFFAMAPMEDVTDAAFRRLIARCGKPHVFYTEFTSADGLVHAADYGQKRLARKLSFSDVERPIVAQLFTSKPENMEAAARFAAAKGFDGIDINMGCPDKTVEKQGCGSALIKNPTLARALIKAAKRGAPDLPVSLKTRIGYAEDELDTWLPSLLSEEPAAIAIHARTRQELSEVPARWDKIAKAVSIRDSRGSKTLIIGNGDVADLDDARRKASETGCDGVMLGRAIYGNPWLFSGRADAPSRAEKIEALIEHLRLFEELLAGIVNFPIMKKHFKAYISGWDNAKALRELLMETSLSSEAAAVLSEALRS